MVDTTTTQQPSPHLDIRHRPNGDVVIKRYPFETVFRKDEWEELTEYCANNSAIQPGQQGEQTPLAELEETIDNWWRTYNDLDYDTYRRIPDKRGKNRFKHHHNMRTHIYKKYKMFFDCCKSPEGIQRMREFNKRATEHLKRQDQRNHVEPMETLI